MNERIKSYSCPIQTIHELLRVYIRVREPVAFLTTKSSLVVKEQLKLCTYVSVIKVFYFSLSLSLSIYIYIYIYMCVCVCVCVCVCARACVCVCV